MVICIYIYISFNKESSQYNYAMANIYPLMVWPKHKSNNRGQFLSAIFCITRPRLRKVLCTCADRKLLLAEECIGKVACNGAAPHTSHGSSI